MASNFLFGIVAFSEVNEILVLLHTHKDMHHTHKDMYYTHKDMHKDMHHTHGLVPHIQ